ncbi:hypothetical protein [Epilithonimonas sp. UC225_85]|uniref:hypothetical protein n=1 Tax=Epilithonimonas sp. UC225_85 TaxID=3350167 RepID=UPI0036D3D017
MKISNRNVIRFLLRVHIVILILAIISAIVLILLSPEIFGKIKYVLFLLIIYNIFKISRLKYIDYENSGEVLLLKSYNVFRKKNTLKNIEIPVEKVRNIHLEKIFFINYLIINIQRENNKKIQIHFPVSHMKRKDLLTIQYTFKNE